MGRGVGLGGGFSFGPGVQSGMNEQTSVSKMFYFELPLDGSKEYTEGEYPFTVKLPNDINQTQNADNSGGAFGTVSKILSMTSGMSVRTEWFVEAKLDIPKAIDMREKVLINVG